MHGGFEIQSTGKSEPAEYSAVMVSGSIAAFFALQKERPAVNLGETEKIAMNTDWQKEFFSHRTVLDFWRRCITPEQTRADADFLERTLGAGSRLLDVPCGNGRHSIELARRDCRVTGVDISADFIREATRRNRGNHGWRVHGVQPRAGVLRKFDPPRAALASALWKRHAQGFDDATQRRRSRSQMECARPRAPSPGAAMREGNPV